MKSLDIDSVNTTLADYRNHQVKIEFTGGIQKGKIQGKTQTVTVGYDSFAKKLQTIHRRGGKILHVSVLRFQDDISRVAATDRIDRPISGVSLNIPAIAELIEHPEKAIEVSGLSTLAEVRVEDCVEIFPEEPLEIPRETIADPEAIIEEPIEIIAEPEAITAPVLEEIAEPEVVIDEPIEIITTFPEAKVEIVVTPTKSKSDALISKPKKSRTSKKKNHGFNKRDSKPKTDENVEVIDVTDNCLHVSPQIADSESEKLLDPVLEIADPVVEIDTESNVKILDSGLANSL